MVESIKRFITTLLFFVVIPLIAFAQVNTSHVYVNGYYRSDGTYVSGHYRTSPNNTILDNFSTIGNINPYTGKPGWIKPENYQSDRNDVSSGYYYYDYFSEFEENDYKEAWLKSFKESLNRQYSLDDYDDSKTASEKRNEYEFNFDKANTYNSNLTQWKANSSGYNFYFKGNSVKTKNEWKGDDLIVYYEDNAFMLSNYESNKDGLKREAIPLATYKPNGDHYYFYYDGESIAPKTTNRVKGKDLIIFNGNNAFKVDSFNKIKDGTLKIARSVPAWKSDGESYYMYLNGKSIAHLTEHYQYENHLIVEFEDKLFFLPKFWDKLDDRLYTGFELPKWKSDGKGFSVIYNDLNITNQVRYEIIDNDFIFYYENQGFIVKDYSKYTDERIMAGLPVPTWSRGELLFNFYLYGYKVNTSNNYQKGNDLVVEYNNIKYILQGYINKKDGKIRIAKRLD